MWRWIIISETNKTLVLARLIPDAQRNPSLPGRNIAVSIYTLMLHAMQRGRIFALAHISAVGAHSCAALCMSLCSCALGFLLRTINTSERQMSGKVYIYWCCARIYTVLPRCLSVPFFDWRQCQRARAFEVVVGAPSGLINLWPTLEV